MVREHLTYWHAAALYAPFDVGSLLNEASCSLVHLPVPMDQGLIKPSGNFSAIRFKALEISTF